MNETARRNVIIYEDFSLNNSIQIIHNMAIFKNSEKRLDTLSYLLLILVTIATTIMITIPTNNNPRITKVLSSNAGSG